VTDPRQVRRVPRSPDSQPAEPPVPLLPVDYVMACYNVVLLIVWAPLVQTSGLAQLMMAVHGAGLLLPLFLPQLPARPTLVVRVLRELYPALWLVVFWRELGLHCLLVGSAANDLFVARLDRALFGVNLNAVWAPAMPAAWLAELMQFFYFSYYALAVGLLSYLLLSGRRETVRDATLRVGIVYVGAYVCYAAAPTVGPMLMSMFPRFAGPGAHGLFRALNDWLQHSGDAAGTAFPSTHVAGAVALAWLAWRHCPRPVAWAATVCAAMVGPATVYTQNHFLLDAVGGAVLGVACQGWLVPLLGGARPLAWPALAPRIKTEPETA